MDIPVAVNNKQQAVTTMFQLLRFTPSSRTVMAGGVEATYLLADYPAMSFFVVC